MKFRRDQTIYGQDELDPFGVRASMVGQPPISRQQLSENILGFVPGVNAARAFGFRPSYESQNSFFPSGIERGPNLKDMISSQQYGDALATTIGAVADALLVGGPLMKGVNYAAKSFDSVMLPPGARMASPEFGGIRAFHGSPYDFDKFDTTKIGTGEGAQAYGHGLYFAENERVADSYRLAGQPTFQNGAVNKIVSDAMDKARAAGVDGQSVKPWAIKYLNDMAQKTPIEGGARQQVFDAINNFDYVKPGAPTGRMFEVNINADPQNFLDWDKPLREQPQSIKDIYNARVSPKLRTRDIGGGLTDVIHPEGGSLGVYNKDTLTNVLTNPADFVPTKGKDFYASLSYNMEPVGYDKTGAPLFDAMAALNRRDPINASEKLNKAGIPGIKYLDQGSRDAGQGSRNYVVFSPEIVEIIKKYGLAGIIGGGGTTGVLSDETQY